jgi:hypothetical protein
MHRKEAAMKGLSRITTGLLLVAGGLSLALTLSVFVVQVPLRDGSHSLVRTASGVYAEVPVAHQTYFQKYGIAELLLLGLGLTFVVAVAVALRVGAARGSTGPGRLAWGLALACIVLGVVGFISVAPYLLFVGILLVLSCSAVAHSGGSREGGGSGRAPTRTANAL